MPRMPPVGRRRPGDETGGRSAAGASADRRETLRSALQASVRDGWIDPADAERVSRSVLADGVVFPSERRRLAEAISLYESILDRSAARTISERLVTSPGHPPASLDRPEKDPSARIRKAIISAAFALAKGRHAFGGNDEQKASADFWRSAHPTFYLKPGVKPSEALKDIFERPEHYAFECATAMVIVYHRAILDLIGAADFDLHFRRMRIGPWIFDEAFEQYYLENSKLVPASKYTRSALRPGHGTYLMNWDVSPEGREAGWQGENVIYLGNGLFYGHPFGIATEPEIVKHLNQHRRPGSTRSAGRMAKLDTLDPILLELDQRPG